MESFLPFIFFENSASTSAFIQAYFGLNFLKFFPTPITLAYLLFKIRQLFDEGYVNNKIDLTRILARTFIMFID